MVQKTLKPQSLGVLHKPCDISGGDGMLPNTGRHSNRTSASLNITSIFRPEKTLKNLSVFSCQTYINTRVPRSNEQKLQEAVQGLTLRPVGSPMRLDLVRWRLTFLVWSPVWPPRFQVIILLFFTFSFPRIHDEMNEC